MDAATLSARNDLSAIFEKALGSLGEPYVIGVGERQGEAVIFISANDPSLIHPAAVMVDDVRVPVIVNKLSTVRTL